MKLSKTASVKSFQDAAVTEDGADETTSPYAYTSNKKNRSRSFKSFRLGIRRSSVSTPDDRSKIKQDVYVNRFIRGFGAGGGRALERMLENSQDTGL